MHFNGQCAFNLFPCKSPENLKKKNNNRNQPRYCIKGPHLYVVMASKFLVFGILYALLLITDIHEGKKKNRHEHMPMIASNSDMHMQRKIDIECSHHMHVHETFEIKSRSNIAKQDGKMSHVATNGT